MVDVYGPLPRWLEAMADEIVHVDDGARVDPKPNWRAGDEDVHVVRSAREFEAMEWEHARAAGRRREARR
ncbi:MAG: hypothetical protein CL910_07955 [Deltaproteobacteria bacterium]|nr:hypothetical protein [Deltaproteobacteria bacterium]